MSVEKVTKRARAKKADGIAKATKRAKTPRASTIKTAATPKFREMKVSSVLGQSLVKRALMELSGLNGEEQVEVNGILARLRARESVE